MFPFINQPISTRWSSHHQFTPFLNKDAKRFLQCADVVLHYATLSTFTRRSYVSLVAFWMSFCKLVLKKTSDGSKVTTSPDWAVHENTVLACSVWPFRPRAPRGGGLERVPALTSASHDASSQPCRREPDSLWLSIALRWEDRSITAQLFCPQASRQEQDLTFKRCATN